MKSLSPKEISEEFNNLKKIALPNGEKDALRALSRAIADLREGGIDVTVEFSGWGGSDSFKTGNGTEACCSGVLTIGPNQHVITLVTSKNALRGAQHGGLWLQISYYNAALGDIDGRVWEFDLKNNENALISFQQKVIELAVRNAAVMDCDSANVFWAKDENPSPRRPIIKSSGPEKK